MKVLILFLLPLCLWAAYLPKNYHHFDFDEGSGEFLAENNEESFELPNEAVNFHDEGSGDGEFLEDKTFRIESHSHRQLDQGEALPIVVPSEAHNFSLNRHLLEQILLDEKVADKKVALIAVAGEYRKGKSFLLNFFLRFLAQHSAGGDNDSSMDWLDPNVPLANRFSFKRGTSTHTKGILLWSQPFLMRNPETGEEVAVLLMDTQGTFDDESSLQDNAIIFSLSTMLSSTMIYNIGGQIKSSDLQYLQFFAKYAELAMDNKNGTLGAEVLLPPFQSLVFLVRDWANSQEIDFGFEGGQQLLAQHLTARESDTKEMRKLRADTRDKLFQTVLCFLMPYPGKIVAGHGKTTFNGNLTEIDNDFMEQIRQFVPAIFSPELLIPKIVNNEYVTGRELAAYFQLFFEIFNNPSMPNVQTVYEVTSKLQCQMLANRTYQMFEDSMETFSSVSLFEDIDHFKNWQNSEENVAISEVFNKTRLMGSQEIIEECRQRMALRMALIKAHYKAIYQQKIDQLREEEAQRKREEQFREQQLEKEKLERENAEAILQNLELQRKLEKERLEKKRLEAETEEQRKRIQQIQKEQKSCDTSARTLGGGFIGGVIGFMLGGPVGAAIGATGGGFMGNASC